MANETSQTISFWPELRDHLRKIREHSRVQQRHAECCICLNELQVTGLNGFEGYSSIKECEGEDIPIVLPCGHIVGRTCLFLLSRKLGMPAIWGLYRTEDSMMEKCPLCKTDFYINPKTGWVDGIHAPIFPNEDDTVLPPRVPRPPNSPPNKERTSGDSLDMLYLRQCWGLDCHKPFSRGHLSQGLAYRMHGKLWWRLLTRFTWFFGVFEAFSKAFFEIQRTTLPDAEKSIVLERLLYLTYVAALWLLIMNIVIILLVCMILW